MATFDQKKLYSMRYVYWFAQIVLAMCYLQQACAQTSGPATALNVAVYRMGVPVTGLSAAQVAASPASDFTEFKANKTYATASDKPVWLRLRIQAGSAQAANVWTLAFDKPFIDKVVLHTLQKDGLWQMQSSGDRVPHSLWAKQSLTPQFYVPALLAGQQDLYVELYNAGPLYTAVILHSTEAANVQTQNELLIQGVMVGLLILLCAASAVFGIAYRDAASLWYAACVAAAMLLSVSYLGIGNYALWTESVWWRDLGSTAFTALVFALQLQFCRAMFLPAKAPYWMRWGVNAVSALCAAFIVSLTMFTNLLVYQILFAVLTLAASFTMAAVVGSNMHRRPLLARLWALAYVPLLALVGLAIADNTGLLSLPWLAFNAPLYALLFEVPVLLVALNVHIKTKHTHDVRASTLATTDPMTGFVTSRLFTSTAEQLWDAAQASNQDLAVAYVEATPDVLRDTMPHTHDAQRQLLRTVRLLRTVVRDSDTVAHIDDNLYAILMPEMSSGEDFTSRLSRLVALGWMTDKDHPESVPVRFRIVASTLRSFAGPWHALDAALHQKFNQEKGWVKRNIRFVKKESLQAISLEDFSQFWEMATAASARLKSPSPQSSLP